MVEPDYVIGLGCDSRTSVQTLRTAVAQALAQAGVAPQQIVRAASITLKKNEPGPAKIGRASCRERV